MRSRRLPFVALAAAALVAVSGLPAQAAPPPGGGDPGPDVTPPKITVTAPAGAWEGWYSHPVEIEIKATDAGSGVESLTWTLTGTQNASGDANPSNVVVAQPGVSTFDITAVDFEGNAKTARYGVGIDPHLPTITLGGTATEGMVVAKNAVRTLTYTCADALTGIRLCTGDVASGEAVPTSTVGPKMVEVWGIDRVDNRAGKVLSYTVVESALQANRVPTISGTRRAGATLTASGAAFTPAADTLVYEWTRDGIAVATGPTYALKQADIGTSIAVRAKGSKAGYADGVTSAVNAGPILKELFTVTGPMASLQGTPAVGSTLTLVSPTFTPTPETTTYTWSRDSEPIPGANLPTYQLTPADAGARIVASITVQKPGFESVLVSAPATVPVQASELGVTRPVTLVGSAKVGQTLRATAPVFDPVATTVTYQWLRDSTPISGAASSSYKLVAADAGRRITVRVVGSRAQYAPTISDAVSAKVARATPSIAAGAKARGKKKVRVTVRVSAAGAVPTGRVTIKRGSKVVATKALTNGRVTIDLARQKKGKAVYTVVYSGSAAVANGAARTRSITIR
ncbi:hypothetical protein EFK50_10065 [Nocardioides marmoriginsengisoli]|uniref:Bacterial Ig-like domain-containing protein n=1 Tax=Nocardioides marmoriginsengisoli TaxID=661483 RepID=A0A3N0CFR6_9ACTN|nr:Ig-like domain repeat protein [Nocardioides marmoriginsengisoli]RNL62139.1 hypothetical protein EFK50_10065 [Nocardioides marmoriginsengisoli]